MEPEKLCAAAVAAILHGTDITLNLPTGEKWPKGWPRGELLSVNDIGQNRSFDPVKVLAHVQKFVRDDKNKSANVQIERRAAVGASSRMQSSGSKGERA